MRMKKKQKRSMVINLYVVTSYIMKIGILMLMRWPYPDIALMVQNALPSRKSARWEPFKAK